jgi:hypothetical protein
VSLSDLVPKNPRRITDLGRTYFCSEEQADRTEAAIRRYLAGQGHSPFCFLRGPVKSCRCSKGRVFGGS